MRPERSIPFGLTDEVGMSFGDAEIVDGLDLVGRGERDERQVATVHRRQQHARLQFPGRRPAELVDVERMLGRGANRSALPLQLPDFSLSDEDLFDPVPNDRRQRIVLIARR